MGMITYSRLILLLPILITVDLVIPNGSLAMGLPSPTHSWVLPQSLVASRTLSDPIDISGKEFSASEPLVIENLEVTNVKGPGIAIRKCSYVIVRGNRISGCQGLGILVEDSNNIVVEDNSLESNRSGGVAFEGVTDSEISKNKFIVSEGVTGIRLSDVKDVKILDNELDGSVSSEESNSENMARYSILIEGQRTNEGESTETESVLVSGNRLEGSSLAGISVRSVKKVEIRDNSLDRCHQHGIRMRDVEEVVVHHNQLYEASKYGIFLEWNVRDSKIYENTISGVSLAGICIEDSYSNSIYRNRIVQKSGSAIILRSSSGASGDGSETSTPRTSANVIFENDLSVPSGNEAILVGDGCEDNQISSNNISEI